ncbi:4-(cytidine 5'-diphospho)-2-C-methyl-D-erythritol kinase [Epibacterium ulvae]|uniref:4-(cytidine 5'-diphospho)-2-C-methyl-D-erythritol kinase n=1 Tax=Epibacterium ulvae TaxID=1156985 RepID=UPI001BFC75C0|nr:4-(cytidine 5'-diphospho)-2-C-methyl-D-erythritol kinase [Epibacterium ulvae]MBT8154889.1 4-(cytidine 5'-diphospho)-2-C-methyl-D-erythritol kinase [Epibacterium ulvae]
MAKAFAPAKINLTLHVTGQRADGYHLLDSLVVFADVGDQVTVTPASVGAGLSLSVTGPLAQGVPTDDSNLVVKAVRLAQVRDADIVLDKHLPAEAGIGGGSSDAAATLHALTDEFGGAAPEALERLGADVPVCFAAKAARMSGTGGRVSVLESFPTLPALLVNPRIPVATPPVFRALTQKDNAPMPTELPVFSSASDAITWLWTMRNDLQEPAVSLHPGIAEVLQALKGLEQARLVRMSGSGATCFALFATIEQAQKAAATLKQSQPSWWIKPCLLS